MENRLIYRLSRWDYIRNCYLSPLSPYFYSRPRVGGGRGEAKAGRVNDLRSRLSDAFGIILGEKDGLHDLVQSDRTLGQKLRDVIHDILVKIREILDKGSKAQLTERQRAEFRVLESDLEGMEKVLSGAIEEAGAGPLHGAEANATIGETRYSMKEDETNERENQIDGRIEAGSRSQDGEAAYQERAGRSGEVFGELSASSGRYGGVDPSFGVKPSRTWVEGKSVSPEEGTVAYQEQQTAIECGVPSFVVANDAWAENRGTVPAFSVDGQIYFRETMPEINRGMLAPHEITHVMRQIGYPPYLDFIERTPDMLNMSDTVTQILLDRVAAHQRTTLDRANPTRLYDEFNATMYGHIAARQDGMFTNGIVLPDGTVFRFSEKMMQHENCPGEWPFPTLLPKPQVLHLSRV